MNNNEIKELKEREEAQLARGEILLKRSRELIKEYWRLSLPFAYEPLGEEWQLDKTDTELFSRN